MLPAETHEAMFRRELDYYGIVVEAGSVTQVKKMTVAEIYHEIDHNECCYSFMKVVVLCQSVIFILLNSLEAAITQVLIVLL